MASFERLDGSSKSCLIGGIPKGSVFSAVYCGREGLFLKVKHNSYVIVIAHPTIDSGVAITEHSTEPFVGYNEEEVVYVK